MPLSRRDLLCIVPAAAVVPAAACLERASSEPRFFSEAERRALGALCDHVLPPDPDPGGTALGAVAYIERWLTALEWEPPRIFAGGPFSGRAPRADAQGRPSTHPRNEFARFLPVGRLALAGARLRLYGGTGPTGPVPGLRDVVRGGIRAAMATAAPAAVESLAPDARARLWSSLPGDFRAALVELTLEAALAPPEYGGNRALAGWRMIHFGGDSQPFGYSPFDEVAGVYRERADAPVSTRDLGPDPDPMDAETASYVELITTALGGRRFR
jgi:hypothetical protein